RLLVGAREHARDRAVDGREVVAVERRERLAIATVEIGEPALVGHATRARRRGVSRSHSYFFTSSASPRNRASYGVDAASGASRSTSGTPLGPFSRSPGPSSPTKCAPSHTSTFGKPSDENPA